MTQNVEVSDHAVNMAVGENVVMVTVPLVKRYVINHYNVDATNVQQFVIMDPATRVL